MKKVFLIHGFQGSPNGGWRPWLMAELEKQDIYACALPMPTPDDPHTEAWITEISRQVELGTQDEIYLVGHSLGVPAILRYVEALPESHPVRGIILVSGPIQPLGKEGVDSFLDTPFNFSLITSRIQNIVVIHGDNDPNVPLEQAQLLADSIKARLLIIPNGGHLNGSSGWTELPQCLEALTGMLVGE